MIKKFTLIFSVIIIVFIYMIFSTTFINNKVMCNNILLDISYIYLISVYLQKYKYFKNTSTEVLNEELKIQFKDFIIYPKRVSGYDLYTTQTHPMKKYYCFSKNSRLIII